MTTSQKREICTYMHMYVKRYIIRAKASFNYGQILVICNRPLRFFNVCSQVWQKVLDVKIVLKTSFFNLISEKKTRWLNDVSE